MGLQDIGASISTVYWFPKCNEEAQDMFTNCIDKYSILSTTNNSSKCDIEKGKIDTYDIEKEHF